MAGEYRSEINSLKQQLADMEIYNEERIKSLEKNKDFYKKQVEKLNNREKIKIVNESPEFGYSLSYYVSNLEPPSQKDYRKIHQIMERRNGERNWKKAIDTYKSKLSELSVENKEQVQYLEKMAEGLSKSIDDPMENFPVEEAKEAFSLTLSKAQKFYSKF